MALLSAISIPSCDNPTIPLPLAGAPEALEFSIGGFGTETLAWTVSHDTLIYERIPFFPPNAMPERTKIVPSEEAWSGFWKTAKEAGVGRWRGRYVSEDVVDGGWWHLRLAAGTARIEANGANAFPDRRGREDARETPEFASFIAALELMINAGE